MGYFGNLINAAMDVVLQTTIAMKINIIKYNIPHILLD